EGKARAAARASSSRRTFSKPPRSSNRKTPPTPGERDPPARLYRDFLEAHDRVYGHSVESPAKVVGVRTVHRAGGREILSEMRFKPSGGPKEIGRRDIMVAGKARLVGHTGDERDAINERLGIN